MDEDDHQKALVRLPAARNPSSLHHPHLLLESSRPCNLKFLFVTDHQCTLVYSKTTCAEEQDPKVLPRARRCEGVTLLSRNGTGTAFRPAHLYRSGSWFNLFQPHHIVNEHNTHFLINFLLIFIFFPRTNPFNFDCKVA